MSSCNDGSILILSNPVATCNIVVSAVSSNENAGFFTVTVTISWTALPANANELYFAVKDPGGNILAEAQEAIVGSISQNRVFTLAAPVTNQVYTAVGALVQN